MEVKIDQKAFQDKLGSIAKKMGDLTPYFRLAGEILVESVETNFEQSGRPAWKDLSEKTKHIRRLHRKVSIDTETGLESFNILVRKGKSGGLMGSIFHKAFKNSLIIASNKVYAPVHQFGAKKGEFGTIQVKVGEHQRRTQKGKVAVKAHEKQMMTPWGDIPARPFLMVQDEDWPELLDALQEFILVGKD